MKLYACVVIAVALLVVQVSAKVNLLAKRCKVGEQKVMECVTQSPAEVQETLTKIVQHCGEYCKDDGTVDMEKVKNVDKENLEEYIKFWNENTDKLAPFEACVEAIPS